jgi:BMFP domain-containing protein YqiC
MSNRIDDNRLDYLLRWGINPGADTDVDDAYEALKDLRDARAENARLEARIAELEQGLASSQTASQHYFDTLESNKAKAIERIAALQARITELEGRSGYCVECERLARRVKELEAQLAGAREDAERLDWIAATNSMTAEEVAELINGFTVKGKFKGTIRAAIDAARKKESNASTS